jgi:hypothetical protein
MKDIPIQITYQELENLVKVFNKITEHVTSRYKWTGGMKDMEKQIVKICELVGIQYEKHDYRVNRPRFTLEDYIKFVIHVLYKKYKDYGIDYNDVARYIYRLKKAELKQSFDKIESDFIKALEETRRE